MKLKDLYMLREVLDKEIEKMEKNAEAQRKFVAKKGKKKEKTLVERIAELEKKVSS